MAVVASIVLFGLYVAIVRNTHSNLCIIFVIAGNFDEIRTRRGMVVFTFQPKLRERKETDNSY